MGKRNPKYFPSLEWLKNFGWHLLVSELKQIIHSTVHSDKMWLLTPLAMIPSMIYMHFERKKSIEQTSKRYIYI